MFKFFYIFISFLSVTAFGQIDSIKQQLNTALISKDLKEPEKMNTALFWKIMDFSFEKGKFDNKVKEQVILEQLIKLTPGQIQEFEIIFQQMNKKASTWGNLAAQTVIEGSSSDDQFYYFRCWLISLGQKNFNETLNNPDFLATIDIPSNEKYGEMDCQFEELISLSGKAYEIVTQKNPSIDSTFPRSHADKLGLFYDRIAERT